MFSPLYNRLQKRVVAVLEKVRPRKSTKIAPVDQDGQDLRTYAEMPGSGLFHFSECKDYTNKHCSLEFKNVEVALESGFQPCDFCRPLVDQYRKPHSPPDPGLVNTLTTRRQDVPRTLSFHVR